MKKIMILLLALLLICSLSACKKAENTESSGSDTLTSRSEEVNEQFNELFITSDATILDVSAGMISYTTAVSYDEVKSLLKSGFEEIGAGDLEESEESGYVCSGSYDGGKQITAVALEREAEVRVMLYY